MPPEAVAAATVVTLIAGGMAILEFTVKPIRRYLLKRTDPPVVTPDELRYALTEQKREILGGVEQVFDHYFGIAGRPARQLVAASDQDRLRLLAEATDAQREHRYGDAVRLLQSCVRPDLPPQERAALHNLIGNSYMYMGEQAKAEPHYREVQSAALEAGDKQGQAVALGNLGSVYSLRNDLEKAEEHYNKALAIHEEIGDRLGQAQTLGNLGSVYSLRGDLDAAEEHYRKGLAIDEEIGHRLGQATAMANLGNVYAARGDLDAAAQQHRKAVVIYEEIGSKLGQAKSLGCLGILAQERGDSDEARELLRQAADLFEAIGAGGEGPETVRAALQRLEAAPPKE